MKRGFLMDIKIYGDQTFRGKCPLEVSEQKTFFNELRKRYPDYEAIATHIRNEGKRTKYQAMDHTAEGMKKGACDIVIPAGRTFLCELKRRDLSQSKIRKEQIAYMEQAQKLGAFVCIALGYEQALLAFEDYLNEQM